VTEDIYSAKTRSSPSTLQQANAGHTTAPVPFHDSHYNFYLLKLLYILQRHIFIPGQI
jgi:hypothetical protein